MSGQTPTTLTKEGSRLPKSSKPLFEHPTFGARQFLSCQLQSSQPRKHLGRSFLNRPFNGRLSSPTSLLVGLGRPAGMKKSRKYSPT